MTSTRFAVDVEALDPFAEQFLSSLGTLYVINPSWPR